MPGAGELGLARRVERVPARCARSRARARRARRARTRAGAPFAALAPRRTEVLDAHAASDPGFLPGLLFQTYTAYYQHPRVSRGSGSSRDRPIQGLSARAARPRGAARARARGREAVPRSLTAPRPRRGTRDNQLRRRSARTTLARAEKVCGALAGQELSGERMMANDRMRFYERRATAGPMITICTPADGERGDDGQRRDGGARGGVEEKAMDGVRRRSRMHARRHRRRSARASAIRSFCAATSTIPTATTASR